MAFCDRCYEQVALCARAGDRTLACTFITANPLAQRDASGMYSPTLINTLPPQSRAVDGPHLDTLLGYTPAQAPALTQAEAALFANVANLGMADVPTAISLARKKPAFRDNLLDQLATLVVAAPAADVARVQYATTTIMAVAAERRTLDVSSNVSTAAGFKQAYYPRATLFQNIVKGVVKGTEVIEDPKEAFDPATGKKYIPFANATKVKSSVEFMYSIQLFCTSMQTLKSEAPRVYFEFCRDIAHVCEVDGYQFAQKYVDCLLRYLDEGRFPNMVALYRSGEYTRVHSDLRMELKSTGTDRAKVADGFKKIKWGPVTKPMGGPGAAIIKKKCNRFHAVPQLECSAGVPVVDPDGKPYPPSKVGMCAYMH